MTESTGYSRDDINQIPVVKLPTDNLRQLVEASYGPDDIKPTAEVAFVGEEPNPLLRRPTSYGPDDIKRIPEVILPEDSKVRRPAIPMEDAVEFEDPSADIPQFETSKISWLGIDGRIKTAITTVNTETDEVTIKVITADA